MTGARLTLDQFFSLLEDQLDPHDHQEDIQEAKAEIAQMRKTLDYHDLTGIDIYVDEPTIDLLNRLDGSPLPERINHET